MNQKYIIIIIIKEYIMILEEFRRKFGDNRVKFLNEEIEIKLYNFLKVNVRKGF